MGLNFVNLSLDFAHMRPYLVLIHESGVQIVAGRAAKQKQEKRNAQSSQGITNRFIHKSIS